MKTIVVTGGSGQIGSQICKELSKQSYNVCLIYNNGEQSAINVQKECGCSIYKADVTSFIQVQTVFAKIKERFGFIYGLINCAGVSQRKLLIDQTEQDYSYIMDVNFKGVFNTTKAVVDDMISFNEGFIINLSSIWGSRAVSCEALYSASKGALNMFTLSLAKELQFTNVKINVLSLGFVNSKMNAGLTKEDVDNFLKENKLKKIISPQQVAKKCVEIINDKKSGKILRLYGKD